MVERRHRRVTKISNSEAEANMLGWYDETDMVGHLTGDNHG